jgi:anti-sigma regulatory factor (Ser/Thr protein kinase)
MTSKGFTPQEILVGINKKLRQFLPVGMFLGVQLISISHDLDQVTIFNAGMPELLIVDGATSQIRHFVKSNSLPLGVIDNLDTSDLAQTYALQKNDKLVLYSDGLTEAWSEDDEEFGMQRLVDAIQSAGDKRIFDNIFDQLEQFCGNRTQADDVTLIEINCVDELLPVITTHEPISGSVHNFKSRGDWEYVFNLKNTRLRETNPVPIIINQIMEMEGVESERQALFTVLTEMFVNALDHGVLGLDSSLKADPAGFALYFQKRQQLLDSLEQGHITFHLTVEQNDNIRSIMIRVEDSGEGFEFNNLPQQADQHGLSGRGIILMRELCESVNFIGKGNIVEAIYSWKTN